MVMGMARLIDADALSIEVMDASYWDNQDEDVIWNLVQDAPTIDAVPVVRCKDCEYCGHFDGLLYCDNSRGLAGSVSPEGFCSYGERREGE
jgi:hypothetical protein